MDADLLLDSNKLVFIGVLVLALPLLGREEDSESSTNVPSLLLLWVQS